MAVRDFPSPCRPAAFVENEGKEGSLLSRERGRPTFRVEETSPLGRLVAEGVSALFTFFFRNLDHIPGLSLKLIETSENTPHDWAWLTSKKRFGRGNVQSGSDPRLVKD